jgi:RNA 3'-terminal phosphate cyclase
VAERQKEQALKRIQKDLNIDAEITILFDVPSIGQGAFLFLVTEYENVLAGFSSLGQKGKPAEKVADEAVNALKDYINSKGCLDPHLADQMIPFMALGKGNSSFTTTQMTNHLLTNIWVMNHFLTKKVLQSGEMGRPWRIEFQNE